MSVATAAYVRTRDGQVVHRAGCPHLRHRPPLAAPAALWAWAAGKTPTRIAEEAARLGVRYRFCHTCIPDCPRPCAGRHEP